LLTDLIAATLITGGILSAAGHIDTPALTGQSTNITNRYVFRAQDVNNLVFVANTQDPVAIFKVRIPFGVGQYAVNKRLKLLYLRFGFYRCFENENQFFGKVVKISSRLFSVAVNPSLKPISIIFSMRSGDSL
jgi:hypothetical protein